MEKCAVTYLCVQKIKIKHLTKFSKDMDFEPLGRVLEHYISNSWVLFWRWNLLAFCVLLVLYSSPWFFDRVQKNWTLPYFVFPFYNPHYSQGRSAVRRTSYILAIPRGLKLKGPPGSSSFIKRSTIVCDKSVLMGLLIGIQKYIVVFLGCIIFLQIGERENTNHF